VQSEKLLLGLTMCLIGSNIRILVNWLNIYLLPLNEFCEKLTVTQLHYGIFCQLIDLNFAHQFSVVLNVQF